MTTKTISGYVISFDGGAVAKTEVSRNGKRIAVTDKFGRFEIPANDFGKRTALTFTTAGFMTNTIIVTEKTTYLPPVILAATGDEAFFEAEKGARLKFKTASFSIPPNAFVDPKGKKVKGKVKFGSTLLD